MSDDVGPLLEALSQWLCRHDFAVVEDSGTEADGGLRRILGRRELRVQLLDEPSGWAIEASGTGMVAWFDMDIWAAVFDDARPDLSQSELSRQAEYLISNADRMVIAARDDRDLGQRLMAHQRGRALRRRGPPPVPETARRTSFETTSAPHPPAVAPIAPPVQGNHGSLSTLAPALVGLRTTVIAQGGIGLLLAAVLLVLAVHPNSAANQPLFLATGLGQLAASLALVLSAARLSQGAHSDRIILIAAQVVSLTISAVLVVVATRANLLIGLTLPVPLIVIAARHLYVLQRNPDVRAAFQPN